jgi:hypothetical protein
MLSMNAPNKAYKSNGVGDTIKLAVFLSQEYFWGQEYFWDQHGFWNVFGMLLECFGNFQGKQNCFFEIGESM